jgi:hypothetical protein
MTDSMADSRKTSTQHPSLAKRKVSQVYDQANRSLKAQYEKAIDYGRENPGKTTYDAQVRYILPRGTRVMLLDESHLGLDGEVWLRVRVETVEGTYDGWVSERYV